MAAAFVWKCCSEEPDGRFVSVTWFLLLLLGPLQPGARGCRGRPGVSGAPGGPGVSGAPEGPGVPGGAGGSRGRRPLAERLGWRAVG